MSTFGERLKLERQRLRMTQEDFAMAGGVKRRAQVSYEHDERAPDAAYLGAIAALGADIQFLVTSELSSSTKFTEDENKILTIYRSLDVRGKAGALGAIAGLAAPDGKSTTVLNGNSNQVIHGDQMVKAPLKLKISTKKKKQ